MICPDISFIIGISSHLEEYVYSPKIMCKQSKNFSGESCPTPPICSDKTAIIGDGIFGRTSQRNAKPKFTEVAYLPS